MKNKSFRCIGLMGMPRKQEALLTHKLVYNWLISQNYDVLVEDDLKSLLDFNVKKYASLPEIAEKSQLVIVIGGDGNMLRAASFFAHFDTKIIGINKGNLGFLTDITPNQAISSLKEVLDGHYIDDSRFLLEVAVYNHQGSKVSSSYAVNEVVLHANQVAHMIEYETYINDQKVFLQRADGLIIATPTGSTAYSLSAGGPIITPQLDAFIITPMFPHSLSSRPLVVRSDHIIKIKITQKFESLQISCDSQLKLEVGHTDEIVIKRSPHQFHLIHASHYNYFSNLSKKLGWSSTLY